MTHWLRLRPMGWPRAASFEDRAEELGDVEGAAPLAAVPAAGRRDAHSPGRAHGSVHGAEGDGLLHAAAGLPISLDAAGRRRGRSAALRPVVVSGLQHHQPAVYPRGVHVDNVDEAPFQVDRCCWQAAGGGVRLNPFLQRPHELICG